jgi:lipooligosaccharide transport system permease protein
MSPLLKPQLSTRAFAVWRRNFMVWKKLAIPSLLGNLADPMIYLFGLGYGLGSLLPVVGGVPYISFLAAGTLTESRRSLTTRVPSCRPMRRAECA